MPKYLYVCKACGPYESGVSADVITCRCGRTARRRFAVQFNRSSLGQNGRWDPVVGQYVANNREFNNALNVARELESEKLGMDVALQTVDARDSDALSDLHGHSPEKRESDLEATRKAAYERSKL
jgi:hypothetical protein